jgi:hypothetical protein
MTRRPDFVHQNDAFKLLLFCLFMSANLLDWQQQQQQQQQH